MAPFCSRKQAKPCVAGVPLKKIEIRKIVSFHLSAPKNVLCIVMIQVDETDAFRFAA